MLASVESRENAKSDAHASGFVADAVCLGPRCAVVLPRAMGPSGDAVIASRGVAVGRIRPPLAVTTRAGVDQPRVERFDRVVVQTESFHHTFLVVLDEHVGARNELARNLHTFLIL